MPRFSREYRSVIFIGAFILVFACGVVQAAIPALVESLMGGSGWSGCWLDPADLAILGVAAQYPGLGRRASGVVSSTREAAYAVDREGVIVAWNPSAESTFAYRASEALGRYCWELLTGQDVFGNRYCCKGCPLRETAFRHEPINGSTLFLRTAAAERQRFHVCMLLVNDGSGRELLVHLCRSGDSAVDPAHATIHAGSPSVNHRRGALTAREVEVLSLLSQGKATPELASDLCISPATARNHIQRILYKLRVHSRIAAVVKGQKLGLTEGSRTAPCR